MVRLQRWYGDEFEREKWRKNDEGLTTARESYEKERVCASAGQQFQRKTRPLSNSVRR